MTHIPLYIDFDGLKVLVIGGGNVGARRSITFLESGAIVTVVASYFNESLLKINDKKLKLIKMEIKKPEDLNELIENNDLIVLTTDNEFINNGIYKIAKEKGKLINNATNSSMGNVIVPFRKKIYDNLEVAVTSLGYTGIAARRSLEKIENCLENDIEIKTLYDSMKEFKKYIKEKIKNPKIRYRLYFEVEKDEIYEKYVKEGKLNEAIERAKEIIKNYIKDMDK
ncbi:siroheme synthase, N-terminal domain protein [Caldisphaera lagunensis DSM 15908]|uniref:precorrin-2 dehydrogenase n=1 Tax=Caldisphaera lagunensis (strain DSM 15908 / JCM 11604 / ANMR 0165 / IC-154) TaxID=1056495 RepID=L0A9W7_CALLD|nr:bifunctional precorrin-2 dehydrogenase/sirohydrochlorin ferrochelatase [Caldisphaera lagunensis]AFZ69850.1 siroheme synthase, N-terminal domain protein [Caldisphaera lagunensis DSM 15908]